jgi:endonuclease/exonuclease/phosphatase family metal-dependent hydrolase
LSVSKEIFVNPQDNKGGTQKKSVALVNHLRSFGRKLFRLPGLQNLQPIARRVSGVAEPAGRLSMRSVPAVLIGGSCEGLTVLSANLWHDWPRRRRAIERLEEFAQMVDSNHTDIVLLQEVTRTPDFKVDEWLSERLGMAYAYSRANGHEAGIGFEEGLAVFSRYPLSSPQIRQLDDQSNPFVRRLALGATVDTPCGKIKSFSVHLGLLRQQNASQLSDLHHWITELDGDSPILIGGDFNAHETTSQIRQAKSTWLDTYRHINPHADGTTHELRWPWGTLLHRARLDYIFLRPGKAFWKVIEARHLGISSGMDSDHKAVLARLVPVVA